MSGAEGPIPGSSPVERGVELTFIGTATVLLRHAGFTFLTDPNFLHAGERAYLGLGLSSKRLTNPGMEIDELPPLDFIVLSHHHGDHFDRVAARRLDKELPIVTEPHAAQKLLRQGFRNPVALETWESYRVVQDDSEVMITSMPGKHAPQPLGSLLPPVMGSMLDFAQGDGISLRLYISGDTLLHDRLEAIPRRYPDIDLCLLHLGGTRVAGILLTMDAGQGVRALQLIQPATAVPIHYNDYTVFKSPLDDFRRAAERAELDTEIRYVAHGETITITPTRTA
jgi:L-ascorbate metabolism protein UlaG (beta-lactamase superfamily)